MLDPVFSISQSIEEQNNKSAFRNLDIGHITEEKLLSEEITQTTRANFSRFTESGFAITIFFLNPSSAILRVYFKKLFLYIKLQTEQEKLRVLNASVCSEKLSNFRGLPLI